MRNFIEFAVVTFLEAILVIGCLVGIVWTAADLTRPESGLPLKHPPSYYSTTTIPKGYTSE